MKVSTKGRYALRMMIEFGMNPGKCTKINEVARRQGLSDKYLEQIVTPLLRAGYVKSVRGAGGGYLLTRDPAEYTVGMILRETEGSLSPVACLDDESNNCERAGQCSSLLVWHQLKEVIEKTVDGITLADLIEEQKKQPDTNLI